MTSPKDLISLDIADKVERFVDDVFGGKHRLSKLKCMGHYYLCVPRGTLATFDDDKLTRIVIASHTYGLRAEIDNNGMRGLKILLHNRASRKGRIYERHPTLSSALSAHKMQPSDWLKEQAIEWAFIQDEMKTDGGRTKCHWICAAFKTAAEQAEIEGWARTL